MSLCSQPTRYCPWFCNGPHNWKEKKQQRVVDRSIIPSLVRNALERSSLVHQIVDLRWLTDTKYKHRRLEHWNQSINHKMASKRETFETFILGRLEKKRSLMKTSILEGKLETMLYEFKYHHWNKTMPDIYQASPSFMKPTWPASFFISMLFQCKCLLNALIRIRSKACLLKMILHKKMLLP